MRQMCRKAGYFAGLVALLVSASYGQSLGDVARQQRQNQQAKKDPAATKVITNEDLPEHVAAESDSEDPNQSREPVPHHASAKSPEQWRAQIEAQKQSIASLQNQIQKVSSTVHFARVPTAYNAGQYNERQEQKLDQVQRMQDQLDQQRKRLEDMQEAARKDGFGNAVYDP